MTLVVFITAIVALAVVSVLHARTVAALVERNDTERNKQLAREANERWQIMTRLQAPALMAQAPIPPPPLPLEPLAEQDIHLPEQGVDDTQDDLIGRVVGTTHG